MINKSPIFINGFQRGGTNILLNLLASHPSVCILDGETHQVFWGRHEQPVKKWLNRILYAPILILTRQNIFWPKRLSMPHLPSHLMMHYIDMVFFINKITAYRENSQLHMCSPYLKSLMTARILGKNVNGVTFATSVLANMYPDARFIGLVRNGLALCEGFKRRGVPVHEFSAMYNKVCKQMIHDSQCMENYTIVRFEDLIANPVTTMLDIYHFANLDMNRHATVRLQSKASMRADSSRAYTLRTSEHKALYWCELQEIDKFLQKNVNQHQMAQLNEDDRHTFLQHSEDVMIYFGYLS